MLCMPPCLLTADSTYEKTGARTTKDTMKTSVVATLAAVLLLMAFTSRAYSQDMVVSEYFNIQDVNSEWTELVVVKDNLNAVGWALTDANTGQVTRQGGPKFRDIPLWRNLRAGTIIVLWHRLMPVTATIDSSAADGYLELSSRDVRFFTTQYFVPPSDLADLNIADGGDVLQIVKADTSHVHALGHNKPTGAAYNSIPSPKVNFDSGAVGAGRSCRVTGRTLAAYGVGLTKDSVVGGFNESKGLPNRFDLARTNAGVPNINHWFWRTTREPQWTAAPVVTLVNQTARAHTISWTPVEDTYPQDRTTGYVILRDSLGFSSFPSNGIVDGSMVTKGQRIGSSLVLDVRPVQDGGSTFIDSLNLVCGQTYTYRVYGYRYAPDEQLARTDDTTARGRQYTEQRFAQSAPVSKPNPTAPTIAASKTQICVGDTLTLTTSAVADRYDWTVDGAPVPVGGTTRIIVRQPGTYRLTITANGGCSSTSDPIVVTSLPTKEVEISPRGTQTICSGDSVVLIAITDAASYEWIRDGQVITGQVGKSLTVLQGGDYIVRTASDQGCPGVSPVVRVRIQDVRVTFSASAVEFGKLGSCESSREQLVSIVNAGQVDVTIASTAFPPGFALRSPAPGFVVKAGQSQQVRVTFAPPSSGTYSGTAVFTALPCSVAIPLNVRGERVESAASLDRALVDYGTFSACASSIIRVDSTFRIVNNGQSEILVQVPQVRPPFYLLTLFDAPKPVAPGASLEIRIQYRPLGIDLNQGVSQQVAFPFTSLTCSDTLRAQLQAAAYQPQATVEPTITDLGVILSCNTALDTIVTVTNTSLVSVTVERIASVDGLSMIGPVITLAPTESRSIPIRITPATTPGPATLRGTIEVAPCSLSIPIEFEGLVIAPQYTTTSAVVDLGTHSPCADTALPSRRVVLVATGLSGLRSSVNNFTVVGPFQTSLQQGSFFRDTLIVDVFAVGPLPGGLSQGSLTLNIGPCSTEVVLPLTVRATERRWTATLSQSLIGPLGNGQRAQSTVTISNTGSDTLTIASLEGLTTPFQLVPPIPTLPTMVAPGATLQVTIEYAFVGYERTDNQVLRVVTGGPCVDTIPLAIRGTTSTEGTITGVMVVAPLNVTGTAGTAVQVPLALESLVGLDSANLRSITIYVSFNPAVVRPLSAANGTRGESATLSETVPGQAVIAVSHSEPILPTTQLTTLAFQTYLAPIASTPLTIDSVRAPRVDIKGRDGRITVLGSCIISAELADLTNRVDMRVVAQSASTVTLDVETITHDACRVAVYSPSGECVAVPLSSHLTPGRYTLQLDMSALASGMYIIVMEHGRHVRQCTVPLTR